MNTKINAFKKENKFLYYLKHTIISLVLGVLIILGISLACGYKYKIVASGSMLPTLKITTLIVVAPVSYNDLEVGDIITYSSANKMYTFTHRVVDFNDDGLAITKGDNNPQRDGAVARDRLVGKVIMHFDGLGAVITYLKQNIFMVGLVLIYLFLMYLIFS